MSLTTIVKGEEELGVQRFCLGCRQWFPFDNEFFVIRPSAHWESTRCRVCVNAATAGREAARASEAQKRAQLPRAVRDDPEATRAYWRDAQRASRSRRALSEAA